MLFAAFLHVAVLEKRIVPSNVPQLHVSTWHVHALSVGWRRPCSNSCWAQVDHLRGKVAEVEKTAHVHALESQITSLEHDASSSALWSNPEEAQGIVQLLAAAKEKLAEVQFMQGKLEEAELSLELLDMEQVLQQLSIDNHAMSERLASCTLVWNAHKSTQWPGQPHVRPALWRQALI